MGRHVILRHASLLAILVFLVLCLPSSACLGKFKPTAYDPKIMRARYESWVARYGRQYRSREEWEFRFGIYQMNVRFVDFVNSLNRTYKLTDNIFADMSNLEFRSSYLGYQALRNEPTRSRSCGHKDLPAEVDWRQKGAVTPIKNQGQCGTHSNLSYNNTIYSHQNNLSDFEY